MKWFVFVLLASVLLVTPSSARQWSFRNGGDSVEAELIDVKDGKVILKKDDGSETSIPLNKLSLGDIRYVNETLNAAESAVIGGNMPKPTPHRFEKPESESVKKSLKSANLNDLHYEWEKGKTYVYRVRITGERGHDIENRSGQITCKVKTVRRNEIILSMTCKIKNETSVFARRYVLIPGQHAEFISNINGNREINVVVDKTGRLLESKGEAPLPYLLGDLSELIFEPLDQENHDSWTVVGDPGLAVVAPIYPYCRISMAGFREGIPAEEKTLYSVSGQKGNLISLSKKYEMTSAAAVAGKPKIEAVGEGELTFDTQRHMFSELDYNMHVTVRDSNKTEEVPLRITYQLLSDTDIAEEKQDAEAEKAEADKIRKEKTRPLTDQEVKDALVDLTSEDPESIQKCLKMLADKKPKKTNVKIANAIESLMLKNENVGTRSDAARALINWAVDDNVPALIKAINDRWAPVRANAIEALCKFTPKEAIKPVAQQLTEHSTREAAAKYLRAVGTDAEEAVLNVVNNSQDNWTRSDAIKILADIGTKKSLPTLEKALTDENWMVNGNARKAIAAIKMRM